MINFTIGRSLNGREWTSIAEVGGAGDSHIRSDYRFVDYNPIPGISYYRLRQTDFDGKFEVFNASAVFYEPGNLFKVFPNPVRQAEPYNFQQSGSCRSLTPKYERAGRIH